MGLFSDKKESGNVEKLKEKERRYEIQDKIDSGFIHVRAIIEMVGAPKEHFLDVIESLKKKIKADFEVINEHVEDLEEKDKLFHTFIEIEMLFSDVEEMFGFCFDYMPSNIELIDPSRFSFESARFSNVINDLLGKLHHMDMVLKQIQSDNTLLRKNSTALFRNMVIVSLAPGAKKIDELEKFTGIKKVQLEPLLKKMIEEGHIKLEDGVYSYIKR